MNPKGPSKKVVWIGYSVILLIFFVSSEAVSWYIIFGFPRSGKLFYKPPSITPSAFERYLRIRDPNLGWPRTDKLGSEEYDMAGARPDPTFPNPVGACISVYGDSFAYGEEVTNEDAWPHRLSQRLSCRVANYGVPGYGTDQAYLRFKNNVRDNASSIVILCIYQENILRIVNQYRYLLTRGEPLSFKPRFIVKNNELELIPLVITPESNLNEVLTNPATAFKHEWFLPGLEDGPEHIHFPYTLSIIYALLSKRVQNGLLGKPNWLEFYSSEHPSGAFQVMIKIVESMGEEAHRHGKQFKIVIFPSTAGYLYWKASRINPSQSLSDALVQMKIDFLDLSLAISSYLSGGDYCDLLTNLDRRCSGHYNAEGNIVVGKLVGDWLQGTPPKRIKNQDDKLN